MPQVQVEIDPETGAMTMHIEGVPGAACEDVERTIAALMGTPTHSDRTPEFYQRARAAQKVRP